MKTLRIALCAALPLLAAAGCNDFLKGGELDNNPTSPTSANIGQLFVSTEASMWAQQTEDLARVSSLFTQQLTGVARQMLGWYEYTALNEGTFDVDFEAPYISGGLVDLRKVDSLAIAGSDPVYLGVAQVIEAIDIGTTADVWGDIPYSQAARPDSFPNPKLDGQMDVYASLQTLLDQAISNLGSSGVGPQAIDLVYGGNPARWIALAHTLKARLYMHTAEVNGAPAYAAALAEAKLGIAGNDGDYAIPFSGNQVGESDPWWQFMDTNGGSGRAGDMIATSDTYLYTLLNSSGDPRRDVYFDLSDEGSGFLSENRLRADFPQPIVTYNENLLIEAEAEYQAGDETAALASLNAERASWGTAAKWHPAVTLAAVSASGPALLQAIMTEKYITLFQNIETWSDYKRTCIPALTPVNGASVIPGRLLYGITERQTNPNLPEPSAQPARNANDPNPCPAP